MAQLHSAAEALNWNAADANIDRFNKQYNPGGATTYGFKGFPENYMMQPKQPLRHQPSADITSDVNRYFRKDSPPEWSPGQNPPPRMASPPAPPQESKQEPNWLEPKRNSPAPAMPPPEHINQTISPRYHDEQPSYRKEPVIRDPYKQLSSAEKRKKIDEFYVAEEDLAMARQRKEKERFNKIEEQRKVREMQEEFYPYGLPGGGAPVGDNRKMKFTEYQLHNEPEPKYNVPAGMKYGDENRGMERRPMPERREAFGRAATMPMVRSSYSDSYRPRSDLLKQQEQEIIDLRRSLNQLEREERGNAMGSYDQPNNRMEMLEDQAKMMKHLEGEIDRRDAPHLLRPAGKPTWPLIDSDMKLRAQDDMSYRRDERPQYEPRAQSEPQTERMYNRRGANRDREIFGESKQKVPEYLNVSPRRHPVGRLYNKDSTYKTDFDIPFGKHGSKNLGNPNKEPMEPYNPFGMEGGGAPMVNSMGQRRTRIAGSMGQLGIERSDSGLARKVHKRELLQEIGEQAAFERARKEREKAYNRQEFVEVADAIRQKKVGYPRFNPNGLISQHHHLPHMFNTVPYAERNEQRKYHDFLERQIEDRNAMTRIGQFEEKRQAMEHYRTLDSFFGRRGGGNVKGPDTRKVNLEKAIHNPQSTSQYYNKVRLEEELAPHEILNTFKPRITINSTHKNLYEYPQGELKTNYSGRTPYAAEF